MGLARLLREDLRPWQWGLVDRHRTCGTRFRNGSPVADCVYRLPCCLVSVLDGRARSHFALVSRSARMIEVESGCSMRRAPSTERDTNGRVPGPPPFPRPGRLARRVVSVNGGVCAIAARRRQAPLTPVTRRGRSPAEGAATPNPLILGPLFGWLSIDAMTSNYWITNARRLRSFGAVRVPLSDRKVSR
jgi:hypothetical protein